ncbi:MAG TPA: tetratricopeptide repeat protein [Stellaceae bacterium]|nr:tetratricopeptide repeat protein [Stellaceae bacterium]
MSTDPTSPVYFILHIPKTAGQTIQHHLADHCAPGVFWGPHQAPRLQALSGRRYDPVSLPEAPGIRAVFGHNLGRSLEKYFSDREIRRVVLLRDPISLHLSLYNHRMMLHLAKGLGTYSFELHLRALPRDFIAHRILARWLEIPWPVLMAMTAQQKYAALNRALSQFWFVGSYTDCDRLVAAISDDLGLPAAARRRNTAAEWEKRVNWQPKKAIELSPATREKILANNPLDQALWESWAPAGFGPAGVRPHPFESPPLSFFLAREIARPIFTGVCRYRRDWAPRLHVGRARNAVGPKILRAERAQEARRWELAARHYRGALADMPNAPEMWVQYGHALKESGNVSEAEAAYRRSINLDPDSADTYLQLGHALKIQGRIEEAVDAYFRSLALDPAPRHPRDELIALGWTTEQIEQQLRHTRVHAFAPE